MNKFSIITVCLNEVQNIRRTCESICCQTFRDFEWIVIDGQSRDGTLDILAEYDSRISCLISEPDKGIYDAMNKGIRLAKGEYLLFLNAGDWLSDSDALAEVYLSPDKDVLFGNLQCLAENGESFNMTFPDTLPRFFLLRNMMPHQASFFRRSLFEKHGGYDICFRIAGDYDLFVRYLYLHKVSCFHVPRIIAVFKTDGISSNASQRTLRKWENHSIRKKYFPWVVYGLDGLRVECKLRFGNRKTSRSKLKPS